MKDVFGEFIVSEEGGERPPVEESSTLRYPTDALDIPDLFNGRDPAYILQAERPEHRIIAMMKAAGHTSVEIAEKLKVSPTMVNYVVKQPWAVELILKEVHKAGRDEIVALFELAKTAVAKNLLAMATGEKEGVPPAVQKSACDSVIDRLLGKATQPIQHSYSDTDLDRLPDEELLKIARGN